MARILRAVAAALVLVALTLALLEGATRVAARLGWLDATLPPGADYWWAGHPELGIWRHPDAHWEHRSACFDVEYRSNHVGARDVARPREAAEPRVVVLGDSFLEGWGLPVEARLSNRLEAATGIPHLNFAMAHFGPYQEVLAYRALASGFEHDAVLIGLLPANDFMDLELALAERVPGSYVYRPYLVGGPPDYRREDHRESGLRFQVRHHSLAFNAWLHVRALLEQRRLARHPVLVGPPGQVGSWFYDYTEPQLQRLEAVLRMLAADVGDRPVGVLLLPIVYDMQRFQTAGPDPLAGRLRDALRGTSLTVVDLLPEMARSGTPADQFYFPCDFHWSATANAVAARLTQRALDGVIY